MAGPSQRPGSSPYRFLAGNGLSFAGVDQGIDFTGAGSVFALGDAVITRVQRSGSGWPGEGAVLNYKLLTGPKAGSYVYVAEDFAPRSDLVAGKIVKRGETIGQATGSGKAPGIEVGWAQPSGSPLAPRPPARPAPQFTSQGADFLKFATGGGSVPSAGASVNAAAKQIPGVAPIEGAIGAVSSVGDFIARLTDPSYLLRGLQVVAGGVLVLTGVVLLTRQVALANDLPDPLKSMPVPVPVPV